MSDAIEQFAQSLERADFSNVADALSARMCCDGHMCGCRGSTVGEYLAHELRTLGNASENEIKDAAENLIIAIGMGWDLAGCIERLQTALSKDA